ncbi:hypothetical protein SAMN05216410_2188 [Sanguibacter gelidistatuariae]|uniref:ABC-2 type transport system permease protein n=1 Tax=Sanguibacter gelidistatuariae TaxID=1814289 RepID=A0A1G6NNP0_9MICO|nr:DUF6297 family protein [Sanguibacter gelidistatuariae]SDC69271.1 hypothetical protein SAMN05216410_2188 [Sanguibacter gelidistatuariae]
MLPRLETDPEEEFTGAEIRDLTARVTASHRRYGVGTVVADIVSVVASAAIVVGLVIGASGVVRDLLVAPPSGPTSPDLSTSGLSLATVRVLLLVAGAALATGLAARLGPLAVSGAGLRWWLPMPVDRRGLLTPRYVQGLLLWSAAGAAFVMVVTTSTGGPVTAGTLVTSVATGAVCGALLVMSVGLVQRRRTVVAATVVASDLIFALTPVLGVGLLTVGATEVGGDDAWWRGVTGEGGDAWWGGAWWWGGGGPVWTVLALLGSAAVAGAWRWHRSLETLGAVALTPAASVVERAGGAVVSLDLRELGRALDRPGVLRSPRRSRDQRWVRGPVTALLAAEAVAVARNPTVIAQVLGLGALIVVAREVPVLSGGLGLAVVLLVVGIRSAQLGAQGARSAEVSPVLDSLLPLSARATRLVRAVVPAVAVFVSLAVGCAPQVVEDPRWLALLAAGAGCFGAAAVRGAYRRAPTWSAPLLATPAGAVPTGALSMVTTGPDLAALGAIPLLAAVVTGAPGWGTVALQVLFSAAALAVCSRVRRGIA